MKKHRKAELFLEELRKIPNISLVCEKIGLSRNTIYRWCNEDFKFKERLLTALGVGEESVNDLAESQIIHKIKNGDMAAAKYWLDNHKKNYVKPRPRDFVNETFRDKRKEDNVVSRILKATGILDDSQEEKEDKDFPLSGDDIDAIQS